MRWKFKIENLEPQKDNIWFNGIIINNKMDQFPIHLNPSLKYRFNNEYICLLIRKLREEIYEHIISNDENSYFPLDNFVRKYNVNQKLTELTEIIIHELTSLGWKCRTSFGGTGLFIYSTENPPPNCYDDEI